MNIIVIESMIVLGVLAGVALWCALVYWDRRFSVSFHHLVVLTITVGIICRIAFALFTPTFYAPDERPHFRYITYLHEQGSFPVQTSKTDAPTQDWEYYQPPLYYLVSVPVYELVHGVFQSSDDGAVRAIQLLSVALWCISVVMALRILDALQVDDIFLRSVTISLVCLLPTSIFMSSVINNDNLLVALGSIILYRIVKTGGRRGSFWIGTLIGLALWVKLTAVIYIVAIVALYMVQWLYKSRSFSSAITYSVSTVAIAGVIWSPWAVRNLRLYGDWSGEQLVNIPVQWPSIFRAVATTLSYMIASFWSVSGLGNNVGFLPFVGMGLTLLALIGFAYGAFSRSKLFCDFFIGDKRDLWMAFLIAVAADILLVVRFGLLYGQGQGRFLFPLLIPISVLMAMGFKSLGLTGRFPKAHLHATGFLGLYALSFTAFSLGLFTLVQR